MSQSLVSRAEPPELSGLSSGDRASEAVFSSLPPLLVDPTNRPMTAKHLDRMLARAGHLFSRGREDRRIEHAHGDDRIEALNVDGVVVEAPRVCQPVADKKRG